MKRAIAFLCSSDDRVKIIPLGNGQYRPIGYKTFASGSGYLERPFFNGEFPDTSVTIWRLDISQVVKLKQQAIATYRSQTTNLIDDAPEGFRLTPQMLANFTRPWEVYLEEDRP